ncbi:MAG: hypothetical protein DMG97_25070 [Acidobacteria bacterium]|nr:MAG: hypothetical protein DMG97_25070 [Acidobacteriota bacterium]
MSPRNRAGESSRDDGASVFVPLPIRNTHLGIEAGITCCHWQPKEMVADVGEEAGSKTAMRWT